VDHNKISTLSLIRSVVWAPPSGRVLDWPLKSSLI